MAMPVGDPAIAVTWIHAGVWQPPNSQTSPLLHGESQLPQSATENGVSHPLPSLESHVRNSPTHATSSQMLFAQSVAALGSVTQSLGCWQPSPSGHGPQLAPPQSMSVSPPLCTPS